MPIISESVVEEQISQTLTAIREVLGDKLLGLYLYGSAIQGRLQRYSDIDLFAVISSSTTPDEKKQLIEELLHISGIYKSIDKRPIELTVVVHSEVNPWQYPPKFDYKYGDWLRTEFESGKLNPWKTTESPDLAIVITQLLLANKILYGPSPSELLPSVPYRDFVTASIAEVDNLISELESDTRNVLLTLARIWSTVETDSIWSKQDAATWAIERLPEPYKIIFENARSFMMGNTEEYWDGVKDQLQPCVDFIRDQIKKKVSEIEADGSHQRSIYFASRD